MKKQINNIIYFLEFIAILPLYYLLKLLPLSVSSYLIGKLLKLVGKFHPTKRIVEKNLRLVFPAKTEDEIQNIASKSWENAGKIFGELATMCSTKYEKLEPLVTISFSDEAKKILDNEQRAIYVSAHYGNWELASQVLANFDKKSAFIYRKINNPYLDNFIRKSREKYLALIVQKGDVVGVKKVVAHLKNGGSMGILADQKLREGVEVEFFGKKVMAPSTPADFAKKFNMPVIMAGIKRVENLKFEFRFQEIIETEDRSQQEIIQEIYKTYEKWIIEAPEQWFFMHNRWGFKK